MEIDHPTLTLYTVRSKMLKPLPRPPEDWLDSPLRIDVYNLVGRWVEMVHGEQVLTDIYRYEWAGEEPGDD